MLRETPSDDVVLQLFGKVNVEGGQTVGEAMQWRTQDYFFFGVGGVQQIQLRTERTGIWGR